MHLQRCCGVVASTAYAPANVHLGQFADEHLTKEFPSILYTPGRSVW